MPLGHLSLRTRFVLILAALAALALGSGVAGLWYTHRMERLFSRVTGEDMAALQTMEQLLQSLAKQKGFVSYYFMDGNPAWLDRMEVHRREFTSRLAEAENLARTPRDRQALQQIRGQYDRYVEAKDRVIGLYRNGDREKGLALHPQVRNHFFELLGLCEGYEAVNAARIRQAHQDSLLRAARIRVVAVTSMLASAALIGLFAVLLFAQVLGPIRRLAVQTDRSGHPRSSPDEMTALRRGVRELIQESDLTHTELEKSRARLLETEKLATVGKLAAGAAHSLRNPMTSIKMRLFSLERSLKLSSEQREDLEVVSEEIRHMDNIVQNFLQYSRPPKLKMQRISPSEIVDTSLQLLKHRLRSYDIELNLRRQGPLPEVLADADQLREVFVNLLVNAMEAMAGSGKITIEETWERTPHAERVAVIRVRDSGPGIPEEIRQKVFDPFFSTKEEGTGLGLSIAARIVNQHRGLIRVASRAGDGAEFTITLPCAA